MPIIFLSVFLCLVCPVLLFFFTFGLCTCSFVSLYVVDNVFYMLKSLVSSFFNLFILFFFVCGGREMLLLCIMIMTIVYLLRSVYSRFILQRSIDILYIIKIADSNKKTSIAK